MTSPSNAIASLDLSGWRAHAAAVVVGALSTVSMAPFFAWPILWLTLPALLWLVQQAAAPTHPRRFAPWRRFRIGRAAETGWWFGFGYHVFGLFWIVEAFLVEASTFAWLIPFTLALPAGLALFTSLATGFTAWIAPSRVVDRVLALALGFGLTEWLRGHVLTGLPWNVLGYALTPPYMMQGAAYIGIYGLTVLTSLVATGPAAIWGLGWKKSAIAVAIIPIGGLLALSASAQRDYDRSRARTPATELSEPRLRIVQPSIVQREKWRPENQRRIFDSHLELSTSDSTGKDDGAVGIALVVWPEAAMPFVPLSQPVALDDIGRMLPRETTLLAGAIRVDAPTAVEPRRVYNALLGFRQGSPAEHVATYDKTHLVPFGEYLPFARILEAIGLRGLAAQRGGFASGPEPRPLINVAGVGKIAPVICYEAIFPTRVIQSTERPRAIVVVTNDGWFGNTTGPRQHFHMARMRAVEEGVPVIRSANNGISALIDPLGRVVASLALDVRGTIDASLPPSVSFPPPYARVGDMPFALLSAFVAIWLGLRYRTRHVNGSFRNGH